MKRSNVLLIGALFSTITLALGVLYGLAGELGLVLGLFLVAGIDILFSKGQS